MKTTIDKAGRVVLPKSLREQAGLIPGEVDVSLDGTGVRIEAVAVGAMTERNGRLFLSDAGDSMTSDDIRNLRLADQR